MRSRAQYAVGAQPRNPREVAVDPPRATLSRDDEDREVEEGPQAEEEGSVRKG